MRNSSVVSAAFLALFAAACGGSGATQDGSGDSTGGASAGASGGTAAGGAAAAGGTKSAGGTTGTGGASGKGGGVVGGAPAMGGAAGTGGAPAMGGGGKAGAAAGGTGGATAGTSGSGGKATGGSGATAGSAGAGAGGPSKGGSAGASAAGGSAGTSAGGSSAGGTSAGGSSAGGSSAGGPAAGGSAGAAAGGAGAAAGSGAGGASAGASGAAGSGGGIVVSCATSADCAGNPITKLCDGAGKCAACVAAPADSCPAGQFCKLPTEQCSAGCKADSDCSGGTPHCDTTAHVCKECLSDPQCPVGKICSVGGTCAPGCSVAQPCTAAGQQCCGATCHDTTNDPNNCNGCGVVCPPYANAQAVCAASTCAMGACAAGFADCNLNPADGCETDTTLFGACACAPGAVKACYLGPAGTEGIGVCKGGTQTCLPSGLGYTSGCTGEVIPQAETCADGLDHNCDGIANNVPDIDGDGWTKCNGDCCETKAQCGTPFKVNPGAVDVPGDAYPDADCDGVIDPAGFGNGSNGFAKGVACDIGTGVKIAGVTTTDIATAMELCRYTTAGAALPVKTWGILSAELLNADGSVPSAKALSDMQNKQVAILKKYGNSGDPNSLPKKGVTMVGLSSGLMRDESMPGFVKPNNGTNLGHPGSPPALYLAANGGALVASKGCSGGTCQAGAGANDSVLYRLQMRVPTNASSFSYRLNFYTAEYNTWQCTAFNDFYLAMLTSGAAGIPADRNISFDALGNPVSVNNGFFQICNAKGCNTCPGGTTPLNGTGMELPDPYDQNGAPTGGSTGWLITKSPVVPAEIMTLDFTIFDVSDGILDSNVMLDDFDWSPDPIGAPTTSK